MAQPPKPAGPPPGVALLKDAALRHLARFATTELGLVKVLDRRIQRWARIAAFEGGETETAVTAARRDARAVAKALVMSGVLDDAAFAAARAQRLTRAGRSRRAVEAHLAAKGVPAEVANTALPQPEQELPSALAFARRRKFGPFRPPSEDHSGIGRDMHLRELAAMARAGFSRDVAEQALGMAIDEANALVTALKRG